MSVWTVVARTVGARTVARTLVARAIVVAHAWAHSTTVLATEMHAASLHAAAIVAGAAISTATTTVGDGESRECRQAKSGRGGDCEHGRTGGQHGFGSLGLRKVTGSANHSEIGRKGGAVGSRN
jgi:hypothetical protein